MQESCAAARIADDENRRFDFDFSISREKDLIQQQKEMVDDLIWYKEDQPKYENEESFWGQAVILTTSHEE
jgi:hypothetical protein